MKPLIFFYNDTAPTEIYTTANTLSLHDALPICRSSPRASCRGRPRRSCRCSASCRSEEHTSELQSLAVISYAVFCLKKKIDKCKKAVVKTDAVNLHGELSGTIYVINPNVTLYFFFSISGHPPDITHHRTLFPYTTRFR